MHICPKLLITLIYYRVRNFDGWSKLLKQFVIFLLFSVFERLYFYTFFPGLPISWMPDVIVHNVTVCIITASVRTSQKIRIRIRIRLRLKGRYCQKQRCRNAVPAISCWCTTQLYTKAITYDQMTLLTWPRTPDQFKGLLMRLMQ